MCVEVFEWRSTGAQILFFQKQKRFIVSRRFTMRLTKMVLSVGDLSANFPKTAAQKNHSKVPEAAVKMEELDMLNSW